MHSMELKQASLKLSEIIGKQYVHSIFALDFLKSVITVQHRCKSLFIVELYVKVEHVRSFFLSVYSPGKESRVKSLS